LTRKTERTAKIFWITERKIGPTNITDIKFFEDKII